MARLSLLVSTIVTLFTTSSLAITWYSLVFDAPEGGEFISFSGSMTVPPLPHPGGYFLWPGLQTGDSSSVYQEVLDGRSEKWWISPGVYNSKSAFLH